MVDLRDIERVRWRGTWGVGDFMLALNVCHNYAYRTKKQIHLEMHWETDEGHLETPDDPETIVERMTWIHTKFHRQEDVTVTHVYNSDLFDSGNTNGIKEKIRFHFGSGAYRNKQCPQEMDWVFKKEEYRNHIKTKKIAIWTPTYNSEPPRKWKRFLTKDDWGCIISSLSAEGWIPVELTYRTPIRDAYKQIQDADYVFCYDGMWHYIAKMFATPIFIPSWEGITGYHCPQVVCRPNKEHTMKFVESFTEQGHKHMQYKADRYLKKLGKLFDED
jgi:hypothetical protein